MSRKIDPAALRDELTIELRKPIVFPATNGETYTEIRLREPTAGELQKSGEQVGMASIFMLGFLVSGVPINVFQMLPARDYMKVRNYLMGFTEDGPETGEDA